MQLLITQDQLTRCLSSRLMLALGPLYSCLQSRGNNDDACTDTACVHLCAKQDMFSAVGLRNRSLQSVRKWSLQCVRN